MLILSHDDVIVGPVAGSVRGRDGRRAGLPRARRGSDAAAVGGPVRGRGRVHGDDAGVARRRRAGVRAQVAVHHARQPGARPRFPPGNSDAVRRLDGCAHGDPGRLRGDVGADRGGERGGYPGAGATRMPASWPSSGPGFRAERIWRPCRRFAILPRCVSTPPRRSARERSPTDAPPSPRVPRRRCAEPTWWSSPPARTSRWSGATGWRPALTSTRSAPACPARASSTSRRWQRPRSSATAASPAQRGRRVPAGARVGSDRG